MSSSSTWGPGQERSTGELAREHVYVYADGRLEFGPNVPAEALGVAVIFSKVQRSRITATCRLSYPDWRGVSHWLVPGVPEALDEDEALEALLAWKKWAIDGRRRRRSADVPVPGETGEGG